jgi:Fe-S-cluster-containing dehydrogenase component
MKTPVVDQDTCIGCGACKACFFFLKIPFRKTKFSLNRIESSLTGLRNRWLGERIPGG